MVEHRFRKTATLVRFRLQAPTLLPESFPSCSHAQMSPEITSALKLLDNLAFRGQLADADKLPIWRAIKLLYRNGLPETVCKDIVWSIQKLGSPGAFGPTLTYYMAYARGKMEQLAAVDQSVDERQV
jgi:hypothetical protein